MPTAREKANYYVVDARGEGGLVSELDRVAMVDQPTLIIGLGGTGTDALLHAKYVMRRKIKRPDGHKQPGRLAFLAVDTDERDLQSKQVGGIHLDDSEILNISEPGLAGFMKNPATIPMAYQRDWLSNGIKADHIQYGAGGIRQCGRFMLIMQAGNVINKIQNIVNEIWGAGKEDETGFSTESDKVNVYILTGISGGTGSGTFLDMAYLVRMIVEDVCHKHAQIRGMIYMPDVNLCKVKDTATRAYIPVNGYAALMELDFWMNRERGRSFRQQYTALYTVNTAEKPFDICFLISPNGSLPEDYTTCMQTTGEALLNILSAPVDQVSLDGTGQNFESYICNLTAQLGNTIRNYSANYIFASLGMDERRLQMDQAANYIAYYLLGRVNGLFDREPTDAEVETVFRKLKLDARKGMREQFDRTLPNKPFENKVTDLDTLKNAIGRYKHNDVLDEGVLEDELGTWVKQSESVFGQRKAEVRAEVMAQLSSVIEQYFSDLNYGPFYAHRVLHNINVGSRDILKKLEEERDAVRSFVFTADNLTASKARLCAEKRQKAKNAKFVPILNNTTYDEYVEAAFNLYDHMRYVKLASVLDGLYNELISEVTKYNNLIVERFTTLLRELARVFEANSEIMARVDTNDNVHSWNIGNFQKIRELVDEAFRTLDANGQTDQLVREFLEMLLVDREAWVGENGDLGESFSKFVSKKFSNIMQETLEKSYKRMHQLNTDADLENYIKKNVLPQMETQAKALFTADVVSPLSNAPSRVMITYPQAANHIGKAVTEYVAANNIKCDLVPSLKGGSLFWFEACFGLPLYAHNAIVSYQRAYDVRGHEDKHLGRQLVMGVNENWLDLLPPILPEATWEIKNYVNRPRADFNAGVRRVMTEAWETYRDSLIQPMPGANGVYVLGKADREAYSALIASAPLNADERREINDCGIAAAASMNKDMKEVQAFVARASEFSATAWQPSDERFKDDSFNLLMHGATVTTAEVDMSRRTEQVLTENALLTPDLAVKLKDELNLKKQLDEVIATHKSYLDIGDQESRERETFANAWMYGLYHKVVPKVYQLDTVGEGVPTFPLMGISDYKLAPPTDKYYAMFQKFVSLEPQQKEIMRRIIDKRQRAINNQMQSGETETYEKYVQTIAVIDQEIAARLEAIDMDVAFDRPEIREFYVKIHEIFSFWLED